MERKLLVIEITGDGIKNMDIVGNYRNPKDAFTCRDLLKKENPMSSYIVAIVLNE